MPAQAVPSNCSPGLTCLYGSEDYKTAGGVYRFEFGVPSIGALDNKVKSVYNYGRSCNARIYMDTNYTGRNLLIPRGGGYKTLDFYDGIYNWSHSVSSAKFVC
ncbi:peptidase inhibitor family I36 [Myceligenerans xiligouense]|uniref:Peptidase inhibitor family I36 n=1 Tax=Myceligenerans xiligouense TaxID=253184 RepID=A0A3N4ZI08_9MICO|nr:peptidase inhibitor family I36 [Myceligenerans xiligouense]